VADLLAAKQETRRLPRAALPDLARLCDALGVPHPPLARTLGALARDFEGLPEAGLPGDLRAELRSYQRTGIAWLCFLRDAGVGALLADDMGLGKTLQALCALRGRTLVVTPTSVLYNWMEEIARFRPGLRASLHHGPRRALDPTADMTLTSYAILRLDADLLCSVDWETVVLDEAQNVKNPGSQAAQVAFRLRAGFRLTMTGTPIENRLDELWSQFHFTNPGFLGTLGDFSERYVKPIAEGGPRGEAAAERLRRRIRPFVLRRRKREVAPELPPRTDLVLRCELDPEERTVYDAVRAATRAEVLEKLRAGESVLSALEALLRLRQAACHRALVPGQSATSSSKTMLLLEELESVVADGHKALVFSQWTSLLDRVEPSLTAAGIRYSRLDGSTVDRSGVVASFQEETGPPVLLVSLRAGGTGLNLTQADHVFLLDPWWNPAVEDQAADRAHRIGQERPVIVYRLVAADTVEEGILALQERKRALTDAALGGAEQGRTLSREDLLALLE
jgi:SNF2 family DNA or RNA helicase